MEKGEIRNMKILIDTNVLIDFLTKRNPLFYQSAGNIINSCFSGSIQGYIAAHTVMNSFYVLRKNYNLNQLKNIFSSLSRQIKIVSVDNNKIQNALNDKFFTDFEDCLQAECASSCGAVVSRKS